MKRMMIPSLALVAVAALLFSIAPVAAQDENPFVGMWLCSDEEKGIHIAIEFFDDMTYEAAWVIGEEEDEDEGEYDYTEEGVFSMTSTDGSTIAGKFDFANDEYTLLLTRNGVQFIFHFVEEE